MTITLARYKSIVVLTGAGISVASGLKTYRGSGGIWNEPETARLSTADNFDNEPESYWRFWGSLRQQAASASPNKAHVALSEWEQRLLADQRFLLITQNVDELHQRAGSIKMVELHGSLFRTRCSDSQCSFPAYRDSEPHSASVPLCPACGRALRPDVVFFDEMLPAEADWFAKRSLRDCDLFMAIGTSGTVSPASRFVEWAKYAQARTVLINLEKTVPRNTAFDEEITGQAEEILPTILK